ncbi:MAG: serine--tRNA ligase [Candidatus Pacearchaeota archaeon]|nr:serine--tRNA ligase [Candidatus Pacearchaeota archaeon]
MIDINLIREKPEIVRESQKKRNMDVKDVDKLVSLDKEWRNLKKEVDDLRARRNKLSEEISQAKKQGKSIQNLIEEAREIPKKLEDKEKFLTKTGEERDSLWREIPNIVDKSIPVGGPSKNKILKVYGKPSKPKFQVKDHADLLENLDLLDTKKAAEVSSSRFYFLKGDLVKLNYALINFVLDFIRKKGFTLIQPPFMLRRDVLAGALPLGTFADTIYKIDGEDLYLIGTSEHALNSYYMNEIVDVEKPIRLSGMSSCFRKEAGTHGKDEKGIFRVHQFEKIEQFVFCKPEDSWKEFDFILGNTVDIFKQLGIPFRTIVLSTGDTGRVPVKTVDIEGWFPSQKCFRELGSCSNCTDYQARRSNIKYQDKEGLKFVNTLNNTAVATERMLACIVENYQQKDGSIKIPKVLWKYAGFKEIKVKKKS